MRRVIKLSAAARRQLVSQRRQANRGLSRPARKTVARIAKRVVNSKAETKMVTFYGGPVQGTTPVRNSTGLYNDAGIVQQNQFITNNTTDVFKLIPDIALGVGDNQRNGNIVNPVSCSVRCKVSISPQVLGSATLGWQLGTAYDLTFVAYLLQHVSLKTYTALAAQNNFSQLLMVGDGTTTGFDGSFSTANMPVEKGYYRLLAKKMHRLRSSGSYAFAIPQTAPPMTNQNAHTQCYEWTWNLGKHLPKKLVYPEAQVTPALGGNEPLNAAPFWCVAYYNTDGRVATQAETIISQEYTSILKYKDV